MSFAVPRNVPDLDSKKRSEEDKYWRMKHSMSGDENMYKDKPVRRPRSALRKTLRAVAFFVFFVSLWVVYQYGGQYRYDWKEPKTAKGRQDAVKEAFIRSWDGYRKYAWGYDVYHPLSKRGENMGDDPLGWIIVDSLDTLAIMGLDDRLADAREWVQNVLNYDMDYEVNTFETSIRMLGGLLSAYSLTEDRLYLERAADLGDRLLGAFNSPSGIPYASVNLHTREGVKSHTDRGASSTAEATTVQMELKYLAQLTGNKDYWTKSEGVLQVIDANKPPGGLVPIYIHPDTGRFQGSTIRLGSRGDSYYEYLIKQWLQTNKHEPVYRDVYDETVAGIKKYLVEKSYPSMLTYISELDYGLNGPTSPKMDHLVCFASGMFALGATEGQTLKDAKKQKWTRQQESDMELARELAKTCYETYARTATGLAPEIVFFNRRKDNFQDFRIKAFDAHNLQRPETVESLFVLWRITRDPIYRKWGWEIFKAFEKHTRLDGDAGYASVDNVKEDPVELRDNMESFWLAETLKYLYLLFDDSEEDILPLTKYVFNTEAHPFPCFDPKFETGWSRLTTS